MPNTHTQNQLDRVFEIFSRLLSIHIRTKTTDRNFHKDSEDAYVLAFDISHLVREMRQNLDIDEPSKVVDIADEAYDLVEELKTILEQMTRANTETNDLGYDNLLRTLAERASAVCGDMRRYVYEADEEREERGEMHTPTMKIPTLPR